MLSDDYEDNDIVGFTEFEEYIITKYKIVENPKNNKNFNLARRISKNSSLESSNLEVKKSNIKNSETSSNLNKEIIEVKNVHDIQHKMKAIAEPNTSYYKINYSILEELIQQNRSIFTTIQTYVHQKRNIISKADISYTKTEMEKMFKNEDPMMIVLPDGKIYKVNNEFKKNLGVDETELKKKKMTIFNIIEQYNHSPIDNISSLGNQKY